MPELPLLPPESCCSGRGTEYKPRSPAEKQGRQLRLCPEEHTLAQ